MRKINKFLLGLGLALALVGCVMEDEQMLDEQALVSEELGPVEPDEDIRVGLSAQPAPVSATSKAAAISKGAARQSDSVGVNGVGVGVHISIPTASLFQCPASVCNQGTANQNWPTKDDVADICYMPGTTTPWGGNWNLVLNHANNQVGFISTVFVENAGNGFNFTVC